MVYPHEHNYFHLFISFCFRTFLHELEACVNDPNEVAKTFLRHVSTFQGSVCVVLCLALCFTESTFVSRIIVPVTFYLFYFAAEN